MQSDGILVGGKIYSEYDLLHMIQYYESQFGKMPGFEVFPSELQLRLLTESQVPYNQMNRQFNQSYHIEECKKLLVIDKKV